LYDNLPSKLHCGIGTIAGVHIVTNLNLQIRTGAPLSSLEEKIIKNIGWSKAQFWTVDWDGHEKAILSLNRF
jgi:hypothetical protein